MASSFLFIKLIGGKATKILPCNIESLLIHPLSLAVWFMDDGGKGGNTFNGAVGKKLNFFFLQPERVFFSVFKFSDAEVDILQNCLLNNFNIQSTFHAKNSSRQLYIPKKEYI